MGRPIMLTRRIPKRACTESHLARRRSRYPTAKGGRLNPLGRLKLRQVGITDAARRVEQSHPATPFPSQAWPA